MAKARRQCGASPAEVANATSSVQSSEGSAVQYALRSWFHGVGASRGPIAAPLSYVNAGQFLAHVAHFVVACRRLGAGRAATPAHDGELGLMLLSRRYVPTGSELEIEVRVRGETHVFDGTVVLVRENARGYELGLWLASADAVADARRVEALCAGELASGAAHVSTPVPV